MQTIYNYQKLIATVRRQAPGAHIAGGAVRDTILEREIRDIDIFLGEDDRDAATAALRSECGYVKVGEWRQYEQFSDPAIAGVAKFEKADETIPVCLIALRNCRTPAENIARFDFGICMAAWDGDQMITDLLRRADNIEQFSYSMVRFRKLTKQRYQEWSLAVPADFERLAKEHAFRQFYYCGDGGHYGLREGLNELRPKDR